MGFADWHGKQKGKSRTKAVMRHNDREKRLNGKHSNKNINKTLTPFNYSYRGLTYEEKCRRFDEIFEQASKGVRMSTGKNATTTSLDIVVYPPADMEPDDEKRWFMLAGDIASKWPGFIDMDVHVDEKHFYKNAHTGKYEQSLTHGHITVVPVVDGRLNGKKFSSRDNIRSFNDALSEMTRREFGLQYNTGKKHAGKYETVDRLKLLSEMDDLTLENERLKKSVKSKRELKELEGVLNDRESVQNAREAVLNEKAGNIAKKEKNVLKRESEATELYTASETVKKQFDALYKNFPAFWNSLDPKVREKFKPQADEMFSQIREARNSYSRAEELAIKHSKAGATGRVAVATELMEQEHAGDSDWQYR